VSPVGMQLSPALRTLIEGFGRKLPSLESENATLRAENAALKQEVADLRRQIDKNSSNFSKLPSSDGFNKPVRPPKSLRGPSDNKSGGQIGH
jgi:transposase